MSVAPPRAQPLLQSFLDLGVTDLVGLPDNGTAALFEAATAHEAIRCLTVAREGEAFAVASGLWLGGRQPVVVVQNTGLLESGDSLRGTALRMGASMVVVVSVRGYEKMVAHAGEIRRQPVSGLLEAATLRRADVDSVALMTEPTLRAWNVPVWHYEADDAEGELAAAFHDSIAQSRPAALLLPRGLV